MFILSFSDDFCTVDCVNILQAGMTHVSIFVLFLFLLKNHFTFKICSAVTISQFANKLWLPKELEPQRASFIHFKKRQ